MTSNFNLLRYTFGPPKHGQQKGKLVEWRMMGVMNGAWVAVAVRQPKVKPILDLREQVTTHRILIKGSGRLWALDSEAHAAQRLVVVGVGLGGSLWRWVLC